MESCREEQEGLGRHRDLQYAGSGVAGEGSWRDGGLQLSLCGAETLTCPVAPCSHSSAWAVVHGDSAARDEVLGSVLLSKTYMQAYLRSRTSSLSTRAVCRTQRCRCAVGTRCAGAAAAARPDGRWPGRRAGRLRVVLGAGALAPARRAHGRAAVLLVGRQHGRGAPYCPHLPTSCMFSMLQLGHAACPQTLGTT